MDDREGCDQCLENGGRHGRLLGDTDGAMAQGNAQCGCAVSGGAAVSGDPPGRADRAAAGGAILPSAARVGGELTIDPPDVENAYARLLAERVLEERADGALCIASQGRETSVGDATQIRFEAALLKAVREAAARGLDSSEATGMFKAAVQRLREMERDRADDHND